MLLAGILASLLLEAWLDAGQREAALRDAAVDARLVANIARAADAELAMAGTTGPVGAVFSSASGLVLPAATEALLPPWERDVERDWTVSLEAIEIPGIEGRHGLLGIDMDADPRARVELIASALAARAAAEVRAAPRDPALEWQAQTGAPAPSLTTWSTPFAGLNPDLLLRQARPGWPGTEMGTAIAMNGQMVCGAVVRRPVGRDDHVLECNTLGRIESNRLDATSLSLWPEMSVDALLVDETLTLQRRGYFGPAVLGFAAGQLEAGTLAVTRDMVATRLTAGDVSLGSLDLATPPPAGGATYALDLGRLVGTSVEVPALAAGAVALPAIAGLGAASFDIARAPETGGTLRLEAGRLAAGQVAAVAARIDALTTQGCTGC